MTDITFRGNSIHTIGNLPKVDTMLADFTLTKNDLTEVTNKDFANQQLILNIFPSVDTEVCALTVKHFNYVANNLTNTKVLCISADLPFAQKRFCSAHGLDNVITASCFRHPEFGKNFGVLITDGPLKGLLARAIIIVNPHGKIVYTEQVKEIAQEPDYKQALKHIKTK